MVNKPSKTKNKNILSIIRNVLIGIILVGISVFIIKNFHRLFDFQRGISFKSIFDYLHHYQFYLPLDQLKLVDLAVRIFIDGFLFIFCLVVAIFIVSEKRNLTIMAIGWFCLLLYMVKIIIFLFWGSIWAWVKSRILTIYPQYTQQFYDSFSLIIFSFLIAAFIWLVARSFKENFFYSLKIFIVSYVLYIIITNLTIGYFPQKTGRFYYLLSHNIGIGTIVKDNLQNLKDSSEHKITNLLLRSITFHL